MKDEDDITPSNTAELADQGQGHSPDELSEPVSAELGDQGYSAAGEVGLIKSRRTFTQNLWRGLKSAPPTALLPDRYQHLHHLCGICTATGTLRRG